MPESDKRPPRGDPGAADASVPVVAIAASAGGLKAYRQLIPHLRKDHGMAYVLIQHLDPTHKSILSELLARDSPIPVVEITDGMQVEPDHVYVIPPN
jgi:two-component system CheB/CheR fusion protein